MLCKGFLYIRSSVLLPLSDVPGEDFAAKANKQAPLAGSTADDEGSGNLPWLPAREDPVPDLLVGLVLGDLFGALRDLLRRLRMPLVGMR